MKAKSKLFHFVTNSISWITTLIFLEFFSCNLSSIVAATGTVCGLIVSVGLTYDTYLRRET